MNSSLYVENSAIVSLSVSLRQRVQALLLPSSWDVLQGHSEPHVFEVWVPSGDESYDELLFHSHFCFCSIWGLIATIVDRSA